MTCRILSFAVVGLFLPLASPAQEPLSEQQPRAIPRGTYPGYEEAKRRANEGLAEPTTGEVVRLGERSGGPEPAVTLSHSFAGDELIPGPGGFIPPDLTLAAGHDHVVAATNQRVQVFDKDGNQLRTFGLCAFFNQNGGSLCPVGDSIPAFDPRVIHDEYLDRFWVIAASVNEVPPPSGRSSLLIGLSNSGDPTQGWMLFSVDATLEFNQRGMRTSDLWCDYPAVGLDPQALYITCNMFPFDGGNFRYSKLRIMTKQQFIDNAPILWWDFFDGDLCEGFLCMERSFSIQPAHMHGAQAAQGVFLVDSHSNAGSAVLVRRVTDAQRCCDPLGQSAPRLESVAHDVHPYGVPPSARQRNPIRIDTGDARLQFAVWRAGKLSTAHNTNCGALFSNHACIAIIDLDVSNFPTNRTVNDWVLDPGPGEDIFYPAADVNSNGNKTMVFTLSNENGFATADIVGIPSSDVCTNCIDGDGFRFLSPGVNSYVQVDQAGRNRWGDYSGAAVEPDGLGIWIYGEFVTDVDMWGGRIGLTQRTLRNPVPHISSLSPSIVFAGTPGLTLSVSGADFMQGSEVRLNGSPRATNFMSSTLLTATILPSDLAAETVAQITVFNPGPGGGTSGPAGLFVCAGSILYTGPSNGLWQTASNWSRGSLPGPNDDVCIGARTRVILSSGTQTIRSLRSEGGLEISSGSLSIASSSFIDNALTIASTGELAGSGDLMLGGILRWYGGTISGTGRLIANGGMDLIFFTNYSYLLGKTLINAGAAAWGGGLYGLYLGQSAVFNNQGTFAILGTEFINPTTGGGTFNNAGTFEKSYAGAASIQIPFNNTGTVRVREDTLSLQGGGSGGGSFNLEPHGRLSFDGNHTLSGSVSGDGDVNFTNTTVCNLSGSYNVSGLTDVAVQAIVNFNSGMTQASLGALNIRGGRINFSHGMPIVAQGPVTLSYTGELTGSAPFTSTRLFTWTGGTISGSGPLTADGGMLLNFNSNYAYLLGRILTNSQTADWTGGGFGLYLGQGAIFDNQGIFDLSAAGDSYFYPTTGGGTLNNAGGFRKSAGTGTASIQIPFNNNGVVGLHSGTLSLQSGGSGGGSFNLDSNSTLSFDGTHGLSGSISGEGTVRFTNLAVCNLSGSYNVSGLTEVAGQAIVNFNPGMTQANLGALNIAGGRINFSHGMPIVTQGPVTLSGPSELTGSAPFTSTRLFTWTGGTISGTGPLSADGGMLLNFNSNYAYLLGRTLTNSQTANWSGGGFGLYLGQGAVFDNQGVFDLSAAGDSYFYPTTGGGTFNNAGVFRKSAGTGTASIQIPFTNNATVSAQSGTLDVSGGYTQLTGSTTLEGGAMASTVTMNFQDGRLAGSGTVTGNVSNSATASPGSSIPGRLNIVGSYTGTPTANLDIRIGGRGAGEYDVLAVTGSANLAGALTVSLLPSYTPMAGDSFDVMTYNSRTGVFSHHLPPLPAGLAWEDPPQYSSNALTLRVVQAGPRSPRTARSK